MKTTKLEGKYKLLNDKLVGNGLTLQIGLRHRAKKGQAKRFIGFVDASKPADEQYNYISSLYSKQGLKNAYRLEYLGQHYDLMVTGLNSVEIIKVQPEKALVFEGAIEEVKL